MDQRPLVGAIAIVVAVLLFASLRSRGRQKTTNSAAAPPTSPVTTQLLGLLSFTNPRAGRQSDILLDPARSGSPDLDWPDDLDEAPFRSKRVDRRPVPS